MIAPRFFSSMTFRRVTAQGTFNTITGAVTDTTSDATVYGCIVPSTPQDISRGYQLGSYKGYFVSLVNRPAVGKDKIIVGLDTYNIRSVEYWSQRDVYVLELVK